MQTTGEPCKVRMRVLLDGSAFENGHQLGIQRYACQLVARLRSEVDFGIVLNQPARAPLPGVGRVWRLRGGPQRKTWRVAKRLVYDAHRLALLPRLAQYGVYHALNYRPAPWRTAPQVVTVYDMCVASMPEWFGEPYRSRFLRQQADAIRRADVLLCISRSTADAVAERFPEAAGRTLVIYPGADHLDATSSAPGAGLDVPCQFVLYVGARYAYKNFDVVLRAVSSASWPSDAHLVVMGPPFDGDEKERLRVLGLSGKVTHVGLMGDPELTSLFRKAACFVFPSKAEGFGFPLVEAQSLGTPVVCSRIPVFVEVAGGAAEFFEPDSAEGLAAAVTRACGLRRAAELHEAGPINAARFRWAECARQTLAVYRDLVGSKVA